MDYKNAGVDVAAGNTLTHMLAKLTPKTARKGTDARIGGFGGLFDLKASGFSDPLLVAATDGVGTKLKIAIDTGNHETIGQDLVAMCANDILVHGAEPLFFLDYFACAHLNTEQAKAVISGIADACRNVGCALIGGETAELPGLFHGNDYDLAGFCVGAVEREHLLPRQGDIQAGDILLALASSGVHSNGYSLIRRIISNNQLSLKEKADFAPDQSLGQALLTPTRLYVSSILKQLRQYAGNEHSAIKAIAHITGGGLVENIPRVLPDELGCQIDLSKIDAPAVFSWIYRAGPVSQEEMLKVFNCGVGMVLVVSPSEAEQIAGALAQDGERVTVIGHIKQAGDGDERCMFDGTLNL